MTQSQRRTQESNEDRVFTFKRDFFCVSNGNAIRLQWPVNHCQVSQKEQWFKEARSNLNFLALLWERNVRLTIMLSLRISCEGQTPLFSSYADIFCGKPNEVKGIYWSCQAHKFRAFPHVSNFAKLGSIVHSHCLHRLIRSYWQTRATKERKNIKPIVM